MRDHTPLVIKEFRGTFDRGEDDVCPAGYFLDSLNIRFAKGGVATRYGTSKTHTISSVRRIAVYKRIGEAQRLIILDNAGQLFDSVNLTSAILAIPSMTDFSITVIYNRVYITPHNGTTGLPGESVYVYEGSGTARLAGGIAPTSTLTAGESATSGNVEEGERIFAVAFETSSGYITQPAGFARVTSTGGFKVDISGIEIGPSQVVARHILATKRLETDFNGDYQSQTYYFYARVGDNSTTTLSASFYDAQLQSDATYLLEQLTTIPAGVGITSYRSRLVVWGEDANSSIARVSEAGEPESFNEVEGFLSASLGIGEGIKNCWEFRQNLYIQKSAITLVTLDTGDSAAFWKVDDVDKSTGAECHSVAKSLDFGENVKDRVFTADKEGIHLFDGSFAANVLTWNVDDIWGRINQNAANTVELVVDPIENFIYAAIPLDSATSPSHVLFGDWSEGLGVNDIRWTLWTFNHDPRTVVVDVVNGVTVFKFGSDEGDIYEIDPEEILDNNLAFAHYIRFPFMPEGDEGIASIHFGPILARIKGSGDLDITLYGPDDVKTLALSTFTLSATPGRSEVIPFIFTAERCSVKIGMTETEEYFILTRFTLMAANEWMERAL